MSCTHHRPLYLLVLSICAGCAANVETPATGTNKGEQQFVAVPLATVTAMNAPGGAARYSVEPQHTLSAYKRQEAGEYYNVNVDQPRSRLDVDKLPPPKLTVTEKIQKRVVVHFRFNKAELTKEGQAAIDEIARGVPDAVKVSVVGHTDAKGTDAYNQDLSKRRAEAVIAALGKAGISQDIIDGQGRGAAAPVDENSTVPGRSYNRRVEVLIEGAEHPVTAQQSPTTINARVAEAYKAALRDAVQSSLSQKPKSGSTLDVRRDAAPGATQASNPGAPNFSKGNYPVLPSKAGPTERPDREATVIGKPGAQASKALQPVTSNSFSVSEDQKK